MKKIAIIRRNGLGDLLCTFPLILFLKKELPGARITLFVDERNAPLLPFLPAVEEIVVISKGGNKYWRLLRLALQYRHKKFDYAISAKTSPMKLMNLFLYILGAKKRVAYVDEKWHKNLVNSPLPHSPEESQKLHQAYKALQLALHLIPEKKSSLELEEFLFPKIAIPSCLKKGCLVSQNHSPPTILVSTSSNRKTSHIPPAKSAHLLNKLFKNYPFSVLILSEEKDKKEAFNLSTRLGVPHRVHFSRNFEEFMLSLEACDLFFVGDGGIAHIGAALNKKQVVLYGRTLPAEWAPLSKEATVLYDPHHVENVDEKAIYRALESKLIEVLSGRKDL